MHMSVAARRFIIAGAFIVCAMILYSAFILHAQEVTELPVSSGPSPTSVAGKVSETIEGIKSGDISTAKQAVAFDKLLSYTLIRISDCWTLCKQETILAKEYAHQEAVQTAKDLFKKGVDAATEQGRDAILEKLPLLSATGKDDLSDAPDSASASVPAPGGSNDPTKIRESIQNRLNTPATSGYSDPAQTRQTIRDRLREN
jgi:hypothetical protein